MSNAAEVIPAGHYFEENDSNINGSKSTLLGSSFGAISGAGDYFQHFANSTGAAGCGASVGNGNGSYTSIGGFMPHDDYFPSGISAPSSDQYINAAAATLTALHDSRNERQFETHLQQLGSSGNLLSSVYNSSMTASLNGSYASSPLPGGSYIGPSYPGFGSSSFSLNAALAARTSHTGNSGGNGGSATGSSPNGNTAAAVQEATDAAAFYINSSGDRHHTSGNGQQQEAVAVAAAPTTTNVTHNTTSATTTTATNSTSQQQQNAWHIPGPSRLQNSSTNADGDYTAGSSAEQQWYASGSAPDSSNGAYMQYHHGNTNGGTYNGGGYNTMSSLCQGYLNTGFCSRGDTCTLDHGDFCDYCERYALHPTDESARIEHYETCKARHERLAARARSADVECGICLEKVLHKANPAERKFGLLECEHAFCLGCIRGWRQNFAGGVDVESALRTCPVCRVSTHFITPSTVWPASQEEKEGIIEGYKAKLGSIDCRNFNFGEGFVLFVHLFALTFLCIMLKRKTKHNN